jgi:hypothetical protein
VLGLVGGRGGRRVPEVYLRPLLGVGAADDDAERGEALHEGRLGRVVLGLEELQEEEQLAAEDGGRVRVLGRRRGEHRGAERCNFGGRDDALAVEDAVERLLLPLELLGVAARGGLVGGEPAPAAEGEG